MKKSFFTVLFLTILLNLRAQDTKTVVIDGPVKDITYSVVETPPEFPGGLDKFADFLSNNIKYPADARKDKKEGKVVVQFVVERDGSVKDLKVIRSVYTSLDEEALRVLSICPKWHPGIQNGKAVRCQYVVPISFSLKNRN